MESGYWRGEGDGDGDGEGEGKARATAKLFVQSRQVPEAGAGEQAG